MSKEEKAFRPVSIPEGSRLKESLAEFESSGRRKPLKTITGVFISIVLSVLFSLIFPPFFYGILFLLIPTGFIISMDAVTALNKKFTQVRALKRVMETWNEYYQVIKGFHPDELDSHGRDLYNTQREIEAWIHRNYAFGIQSIGDIEGFDMLLLERLRLDLAHWEGFIRDLEAQLKEEAQVELAKSGIPRESREVPRESAAELKRREQSETNT